MIVRYFEGPDCYRWRKVFAFLPVRTISGRYVWFDKVYKQKFYSRGNKICQDNYSLRQFVEYAEIFDLLKLDEADYANN